MNTASGKPVRPTSGGLEPMELFQSGSDALEWFSRLKGTSRLLTCSVIVMFGAIDER